MRKTCLNMVETLSQRDVRVVFIGSDLSPGLLSGLRNANPERHYMEGVSEAHVVGMAAGMAMDGYMPFVNTIATFITRRCFEQVALDVCLHRLPVRLIGNGGGYVYAPLGPTHLAVDDIALMRSLPHMTVTAVADADEMVRLMEATINWPDPIYIRLGKGGDPIVSDAARGFEIGKGIVMREARSASPVLMVSCGVMTARALDAAALLAEQGIEADVIHLHTIKPIDAALLAERTARASMLVTVEEHSRIGGLGDAVIDGLLERGAMLPPIIQRLALPDRFAENYGSQDALLEACGLQPPLIAAAVRQAADGEKRRRIPA